jgi:hypothetical protein
MNALPLLETEPLSPEANRRIFTVLARKMTLHVPAVTGSKVVDDQADVVAASNPKRPHD